MSRSDITGAIGSVPPPNAPREVAQPLDASMIDTQLRLARQNEQVLPPFNPQPIRGSVVQTTPPPAPKVIELQTTPSPFDALVADVFGDALPPMPAIVLTDPEPRRDVAALTTQAEVIEPAEAPEIRTALPTMAFPLAAAEPHQRAASNSDSPSRGIPRGISDPGKAITGGFGSASDAQYFPLDGTELRELVFAKMELIADRLRNDLRFSMAATYPRVSVKVLIEVSGYTLDTPMQIQQVVEHTKTPEEIAAAKGATPTAFTVDERASEFADDGSPDLAPNQIRQDLGLSIPRKQAIDSGAGRVIVDVTT